VTSTLRTSPDNLNPIILMSCDDKFVEVLFLPIRRHVTLNPRVQRVQIAPAKKVVIFLLRLLRLHMVVDRLTLAERRFDRSRTFAHYFKAHHPSCRTFASSTIFDEVVLDFHKHIHRRPPPSCCYCSLLVAKKVDHDEVECA
jgi:hypothetical protein